MTLLLAGLGVVLAVGVVAAGALWRRLARRDHRCTVATRTSGCDACVAVLRGGGRGGHVLCACGAGSPHLYGTALLAWRAEHQGETFPGTPAHAAEPGARVEAADGLTAGPTAARAETERRAAARARRRPDPATPQVLREAAAAVEDTDVPRG